jgi:predicted nucleic acid-binding protein
VQAEAEAVLTLLEMAVEGTVVLVSSEAAFAEVFRIRDDDRREPVLQNLLAAQELFGITAQDVNRTAELLPLGIKGVDALHVSVAERANVDALLTTDDALLKAA